MAETPKPVREMTVPELLAESKRLRAISEELERRFCTLAGRMDQNKQKLRKRASANSSATRP